MSERHAYAQRADLFYKLFRARLSENPGHTELIEQWYSLSELLHALVMDLQGMRRQKVTTDREATRSYLEGELRSREQKYAQTAEELRGVRAALNQAVPKYRW